MKNLQRASGSPAGAADSGEIEFCRKVWADCLIEPAGNAALPPARTNTYMRKSDITRREFLILSGAVTAAALVTVRCDGGSGPGGAMTVYKLSLRGRRGSNAAKSHNANMLFATIEAADMNRAHPGDNSRIVSVSYRQGQVQPAL